MAATMGLAYTKAETGAMTEHEYLTSSGPLPVRVGAHYSYAGSSNGDREDEKQAKQTSSEFMTLANREMSQMVSLARANGYDATDFDDFETHLGIGGHTGVIHFRGNQLGCKVAPWASGNHYS